MVSSQTVKSVSFISQPGYYFWHYHFLHWYRVTIALLLIKINTVFMKKVFWPPIGNGIFVIAHRPKIKNSFCLNIYYLTNTIFIKTIWKKCALHTLLWLSNLCVKFMCKINTSHINCLRLHLPCGLSQPIIIGWKIQRETDALHSACTLLGPISFLMYPTFSFRSNLLIVLCSISVIS